MYFNHGDIRELCNPGIQSKEFTDFSDLYFEHLLFQLFLCRMGKKKNHNFFFSPSLNCYGGVQCVSFSGGGLHAFTYIYIHIDSTM